MRKTVAWDSEIIRSRRHTEKINLPRALCFFPCSLFVSLQSLTLNGDQTLLVQGSLFTCPLGFLRTWPPLPLAYSTWSTLNTGQILVMTEEKTEEVRCEEEKVDFEASTYFVCWVGYLRPNIFFKINFICLLWAVLHGLHLAAHHPLTKAHLSLWTRLPRKSILC